MSLTQDEFTRIVRNSYPAKYMSPEFDPIYGFITVFALDTQYEVSLPFNDKFKLASHIWQEGRILKDSSGLFNSTVTSVTASSTKVISLNPNRIYFNGVDITGGISVHYGPGDYNDSIDLLAPSLKCEPCTHSWKTYDSGWNKYDYCEKCNIKENV
jgi:hypothetical protein